MYPRIRYRKLLALAFLPRSVLTAAMAHQNPLEDHLAAYLCFAFEKTGPESFVTLGNFATFAPGLQNSRGQELYCCFEPNWNGKQPWALTKIGPKEALPALWGGQDMPIPASTLSEFNQTLFQFAFVQQQKFESISRHFQGNAGDAITHIMYVFSMAHRYGYIHYENKLAIFHTGLCDAGEPTYALFMRNRNQRQPWFLIGFMHRSMIRGVQTFPDYVLQQEIYIVHQA